MYIEFVKDHLSYKVGQVLEVGLKLAKVLEKEGVAKKSTKKAFDQYNEKVAEEKAEAKVNRLAAAKASANKRNGKCEDCEGGKPCKDCDPEETDPEETDPEK